MSIRFDKTLRSFFLYCFVLFAILNCNSLISHIFPAKIFTLGTTFTAFGMLFFRKKYILNDKTSVITSLFLMCMLFLFVFKNFLNAHFVLEFVFILLSFMLFFSYYDNILKFIQAYNQIVIIISVISLFFYFSGSVLHIVPYSQFYSHNLIGWGETDYHDYYHLYNEGQPVVFQGRYGLRNIGIFVEAPIYAFILVIALYFELYILKSKNQKLWIVILSITILTSFSTTGIILMIAMIITKPIIQKQKQKFKFKLLATLIFALGTIAAYVVVTNKLSTSAGSDSANVRTSDMLSAIKCFLDHPIAGIGYGSMEIFNQYKLNDAGSGSSTGIGLILVYGGLLLFVWYVMPAIIMIYKYSRKRIGIEKIGLEFVWLFLLIFTVVPFNVLSAVILAMCWTYSINKERKNAFDFLIA